MHLRNNTAGSPGMTLSLTLFIFITATNVFSQILTFYFQLIQSDPGYAAIQYFHFIASHA